MPEESARSSLSLSLWEATLDSVAKNTVLTITA